MADWRFLYVECIVLSNGNEKKYSIMIFFKLTICFVFSEAHIFFQYERFDDILLTFTKITIQYPRWLRKNWTGTTKKHSKKETLSIHTTTTWPIMAMKQHYSQPLRSYIKKSNYSLNIQFVVLYDCIITIFNLTVKQMTLRKVPSQSGTSTS